MKVVFKGLGVVFKGSGFVMKDLCVATKDLGVAIKEFTVCRKKHILSAAFNLFTKQFDIQGRMRKSTRCLGLDISVFFERRIIAPLGLCQVGFRLEHQASFRNLP